MLASTPAIGVILPSSNRVVERATHAILAEFPGVDACFARVPYAGHPTDGYDLAPFRQAAALLAEARPGAIVWNATRGALLGFEPDRRLCAMIHAQTGIPATSTALATADLLQRQSRRRIALLAQGSADDCVRLVQTFGREGIDIIASHALGITDNFRAALVSAQQITDIATSLAASEPDAILIWSTNLSGHTVSHILGQRLGIPVYDSAAIGTSAALAQLRSATPAPTKRA
jgi:maleate isomerase